MPHTTQTIHLRVHEHAGKALSKGLFRHAKSFPDVSGSDFSFGDVVQDATVTSENRYPEVAWNVLALKKESWVRTIAPLVLIFAFLLMFVYVPPTHAAGLSFGFGTTQDVVNGMIVSIDQENADSVEQANVNNADYVVGVAVNQASSSVVFDNDDAVYVATEGSVQVFVSTVGGDISKGDLIVVSGIGGVGRKKAPDTDDGQKIVGIAKGDFSQNSEGAEQITLENAGQVSVGLLEVEMLISEPAAGQADSDDINVLVRVGRRIAGKPVSLSQVIVTASVVIVAFVVSGALLFGAVKGSFTSIGRNPLSAKTIYQGMMRASFISLGVMMIGIVAGYVVLIL